PDAIGGSVERRRDLHCYAPAIRWVEDASREAHPLQAVDHPRDGAAGEPGLSGQFPGAEPAGVFDDVEAAEVGLRHPEPLGGEAVDRIVLIRAHPELADELLDQVLLRSPR